PQGNYTGLDAGAAGQVFYVARSEAAEGGGPRGGGRGGFGGGVLHRYDLDRRRDATVQQSVGSYELTPDGRKMLYSSGGNWYVVPTTGSTGGTTAPAPAAGGGRRPGGPPGRPATAPAPSPSGGEGGDGRLNLDAIEVRIDPRAEWKQIFEEAWRINRDFFYDPNMHGADWKAVKAKYEVFLPDLAVRQDLNRVMTWMSSELSVGHHRLGGGDSLTDVEAVPGGLLGADYK